MAEAKHRENGVVKIYFSLKEYGFITRKKGKDLFFSRSSFSSEDQIVQGASVEFSTTKDSKGEKAFDIQRIS